MQKIVPSMFLSIIFFLVFIFCIKILRDNSVVVTKLGFIFFQAVTNLCWQRSKPVMVNENNCSDDTVLLAGDVGDSVLMPDPLPSRASSSLSMPSMVSGSKNPTRSGSGDLFSFPAGSASSTLNSSASEETPLRSSLLTGGTLTRLHAPRNYNFKDDMEVFSPLVEVQPITPSLDKFWTDHDGSKKNVDGNSSFLFPSRRFGLSEEGTNDNHPIFDWKSNSSSKQVRFGSPWCFFLILSFLFNCGCVILHDVIEILTI